jgi:hypothetical protein
MVKILRYCLAFGLLFAFAGPVFAQSDYPTFQLAPGYGNIKFGIPNIGFASQRHSGFVLDTSFNFHPVVGFDLYTGYYSIAQDSTLYTNTFGLNFALRKYDHITPYGTAGFGFGIVNFNGFGERSMATRIGGGIDIPLGDSMAIRGEATHMGYHFEHEWHGGMNLSVGIVLNLSQ